MKCILILVLCTTLHAESKIRKVWKWSTAALITGATLDLASSVGQYEANPLARQANGRFSAGRGITLKAGVCTGLVILGKKYPTLGTTANFTAGGAWAGVAIRNWRIR